MDWLEGFIKTAKLHIPDLKVHFSLKGELSLCGKLIEFNGSSKKFTQAKSEITCKRCIKMLHGKGNL